MISGHEHFLHYVAHTEHHSSDLFGGQTLPLAVVELIDNVLEPALAERPRLVDVIDKSSL